MVIFYIELYLFMPALIMVRNCVLWRHYPGFTHAFIVHSSFVSLLSLVGIWLPAFMATSYALTLGVVGAPQMTSQLFPSILPCSPLPSRTWRNSRPVHSLMLSSDLFFCLSCLLPPFTVPCKMVLARPDEREHVHSTTVCVFLRWSGGLRVVQLPAGSSL